MPPARTPSRITLLRPAHYPTTPWKNGRGETTEIARAPHPDGTAEFAWRLSKAPIVADGPFSLYPGVDRTTTIIEGQGLELTFDDGSLLRLLPGEPRTFDGGLAVTGRLIAGPVRAFNVMTARGGWRSTVRVLIPTEGMALPVPSGGVAFAYGLEGSFGVSVGGESETPVSGGDTAQLIGPAEARLSARLGCRLLVALIEPL